MKVIKKERKLYLKMLIHRLKDKFKECMDFKNQEIKQGTGIYIVYFNGLVDLRAIDQDILKPITQNGINSENMLRDSIANGKIYNLEIKEESDINKISEDLLSGNTAVVINNIAYIFETKNILKRSIQEPNGEKTSKGAKESFIEVLTSNIAMVRRRTKSSKLKTKEFKIGTVTSTNISMVYMEDEVDKELLKNIEKKLENIDIPAITCLSDFEENVVDHKYSLFPQLIYTERPDKFCSNILEGKVGIIIDGFSSTYILPGVFAMFMQSTEEYSTNYIVSSAIRFIRYVALLISLLLPAVYVAITSFHQEMIPTKLTEAIINSKQDVPFPAFLEIIVMLIAFEVLLEAGARMPENIGQTVSIVGGLIVGEAAVNAKFVSPAVVVIVATSGICGFLLPNQDLSNATRVNRFLLVLGASVAGLFGVSIGIIVTTYYMSNLDSFGMPYLKPFVANENKNMTVDTIFRGIIHKTKKKMSRW